MSGAYDELARLGTATVYEAAGRQGMFHADLIQVVPGSRAAGPARTVLCAQNDNLMVHAAMERAQPGEVLVVTMPIAEPVALMGELLATQAKVRGVAAVLVNAAVRDVEELRELGLPIWARWVRVWGAGKDKVGVLDQPLQVEEIAVAPGDGVVLDADGAVIVQGDRIEQVLEAAETRAERETVKRARLEAGELSYEMDGLRKIVEGG